MKKLKENLKPLGKWIIGIAIVCILFYLGTANLGAVSKAIRWFLGLFTPLTVGFFIALILNVPMSFFEKILWPKAKKKVALKLRRPVAFILSLILILGILTGIFILVLPELANAAVVIAGEVLDIVKELQSTPDLESLPFGNILVRINWKEIGATAEKWLKAQSGNLVEGAMDTVINLVGGIIDAVLAVIFSVYILFGKETLKHQTKRLIKAWLPQRGGNYLIHTASVANKVFRNFISGQTIEAIILGVLCTLGMLILRIPYAPMIGALVGVFALIPVAGAFIAGGIGAFMIFTESPVKALIFIIYLVILQQIEGNLIYPKVVGNKIKLPAIWVLAAVTIGASVAGVAGVFLGIPLASTAYVLIREATEKREQKSALCKVSATEETETKTNE